jgi:hypothetical protein
LCSFGCRDGMVERTINSWSKESLKLFLVTGYTFLG